MQLCQMINVITFRICRQNNDPNTSQMLQNWFDENNFRNLQCLSNTRSGPYREKKAVRRIHIELFTNKKKPTNLPKILYFYFVITLELVFLNYVGLFTMTY